MSINNAQSREREKQLKILKSWTQIDSEMETLARAGAFEPLRNIIINPVSLEPSHISGPKTREEWTNYELKLLQRVEKVLEGTEKPCWKTLFFKNESDFISGQWTHNKENWRTLIAALPEKSKAITYHFVMAGADLFLNLRPIPRKTPLEFKKKKLCTRWKRNESNADLLKKLGGNCKTWNNGRLRITKHVPRPYEVRGNIIRSLQVPSQEAVRERSDEVRDQILKWCKMGSITRLEKAKKPWLTAGFILVDKPGRETRVCWNGGIMKPLELYTFPCRLDGITAAIQMMKKGDLLFKFDDKKGYHQMPLSRESRKLAAFKWGKEYFVNNILAFGIPAAPGIYQLMNSVAINFLKLNGVKITLYLDDRLLIVSPKSEQVSSRIKRKL